jgi:hypothetical protein
VAPSNIRFEASLPNGAEALKEMSAAGWEQVGEVEYSYPVADWSTTREPLAAAMNAALAPFLPYWLGGFPDAAAAATLEHTELEPLAVIFDAWAAESHPQWYSKAADPLPAGAREQLSGWS